MGHAPLRFPRIEPFLLRRPGGRDDRPAGLAAHYCPSGEWRVGVGEHAPKIRERVCENLNYLGLELDPTANETCKPDADVAMPASAARVLVIATREDLTILRETRQLVSSSISQPPGNEHALHQ